eukprot:TRINITY_DN10729_c0_g4_i2.p1 TRINITY_DN10729_c0_g4~~TRINITY_DN10729_c0_g4_i2.p1  ORF type:complete len:186 (+),score=42.72 TRINITY_DN10729_c0_g4_i2:77-634(+)
MCIRDRFAHVQSEENIAKSCLKHLSAAVEVKSTSDCLIYAKGLDKSLMLLGYYRNALGRVFLYEGFATCWLSKLKDGRVAKEVLKNKYEYLADLLQVEYIVPSVTFCETVELLKSKGVVTELKEGTVEVGRNDTSLFWVNYLASFVWPLIECYFANALFLYSFIVGRKMTYATVCHKVCILPHFS